jgi:hypothetical protein
LPLRGTQPVEAKTAIRNGPQGRDMHTLKKPAHCGADRFEREREIRGRSPAIVLFECCHLGAGDLLIDGCARLLDRAFVGLPGFACDVLVSRYGAFRCHEKHVGL